nr:asparagine synthase C-terminal domain-containing protein [Novosphingobium profundi]
MIGSDPELIAATGYWRPAIAWANLACHLYTRGLPTPATSLEGLVEILPGHTCDICDASVPIEALWSPWDHVASDAVADRQEQAEALRRTVQNAVSAWSSRYSSILIGVSGGLDSSIVAASLTRGDVRVTGVTLITEDPDGDERPFTRQLAQGLGLEIHEIPYDLADIDLGLSCVAHLARPIGRSHALAYDRPMHRLARASGVEAFFSGNGGDNVFYYTQSANPVADRLLADGAGVGALHTLRDVSRLTGCTPLQAAAATIASLRTRRGGYQWRTDPTFLHARTCADLVHLPAEHPWLREGRARAPGKAAHIAALLRIQSGLEGYDRSLPPMINPLMSQPVIERCLAVPSWMWVEAGRDRALARRAFAPLLPDAIHQRRSKGGPDGFANQVIHRHRAEIIERLTCGHLAREKIIDSQAIVTLLSDERPTLGADQARLLSLLDTEAWVSHWSP